MWSGPSWRRCAPGRTSPRSGCGAGRQPDPTERPPRVAPIRFIAYAMAYATHEDMTVLRRYVSDDNFREALDKAPPSIIDPRSWACWNSKMGRYPPPLQNSKTFG